jgi:hypothetical protein
VYRINGVPIVTSAQSPWTQDIDGAGFKLSNASQIGIGVIPSFRLEVGCVGTTTLLASSPFNLRRTSSTLAAISVTGLIAAHPMLYSPIGTDDWAFGFDFGTSVFERVRITSAGNVGIGTTGPQAPLHVFNPAGSVAGGQPTVYIGGNYSATAGTGVSLRFVDSSNNMLGEIRSLAEGPGQVGLSFSTYSGGGAERMRITSAGNVGIGTTGPGAKLDVQGGSIRTSDNYSTGKFEIGSIGSYLGRNPSDGSTILHSIQGYLLLNPFSGNVMVGSGGPANYKLDVAGDVNSSGVFRVGGVPVATIAGRYDLRWPRLEWRLSKRQ